ncbi:MAG: protein phosphatase 2C domain-containing protein [Chromatiaceae bacterium]|jgi:serine/threonine protein phosphatase PrpC|nr:protein phosphatase 2C domain-containing protein [Chromatiaceae bacterium]
MAVNSIELAIRTHQGLVRTRNQDSFKVDAGLGIIVLADGMGGHRSGEVASRVAVEAAIADLLPAQREDLGDGTQSLLRVGHAAEVANRALLDMCVMHPELSGMGTTVVLAIFRDGRIYHAHVGDSRLYRVRYGRMRRLTRDHSLIQRVIDDGVFLNRAEAREAGIRDNVLTRSLGMQRQADVDVGDALLEVGDTYLICSDGLHGMLPDSLIAKILRDPHGDLEEQVENLLGAALAAGGNDNVTAILARPILA